MLYLRVGALLQYVFSLVSPSNCISPYSYLLKVVSLFVSPGLPEEYELSELLVEIFGYKSVGLEIVDHFFLPPKIHSWGYSMKKLIHLESTNQRWRIRRFERAKKRREVIP